MSLCYIVINNNSIYIISPFCYETETRNDYICLVICNCACSLTAMPDSACSLCNWQEVEQLRLERLQIDEQLRQIGVGYRAPPSRSGSGVAGERERGYLTDESTNSLQTTRTYGGRGRGRKSNNTYSGYGEIRLPWCSYVLDSLSIHLIINFMMYNKILGTAGLKD